MQFGIPEFIEFDKKATDEFEKLLGWTVKFHVKLDMIFDTSPKKILESCLSKISPAFQARLSIMDKGQVLQNIVAKEFRKFNEVEYNGKN